MVSGNPVLAVNSSGVAVSAFEYYDGVGNYIYAVSQPTNGVWSYPPDQISLSGTDQDIRIAINDNGDAVAIWNDLNGPDDEVYAARFIGGVWQAPQEISTGAVGFDSYPGGVAIDGSGTSTITWEAPTAMSTTKIFSRTLSVTGVLGGIDELTLDAMAPVSTGNSKVAVTPSGYAVAIWRRGVGALFTIQASTRTGVVWSAPVDLSDGVTNAEDASIAVDGSGNAVAVWRQIDGMGFTTVRSRSLPFGGAWSGTSILSPAGANATPPVLSMNSDGRASAIWQLFTGEIQSATLPSVSDPWDSYLDIAMNSSSPSISMDTYGNAIAVWLNPAAGANEVYSALLPLNAMAWDAPTQISANAGTTATFPQVGAGPFEYAVAVWQFSPQSVIQSTYGFGMMMPVVPVISSISGGQTQVRFASQSDLVNTIRWTPSSDAAFYKIYRDVGLSVLAAITENAFFEDHHRAPGTPSTYYVIPVSGVGIEGAVVSVTVP